MVDPIADRTWMCEGCGYVMDACSSIMNSNAAPKDGDLSLCLNCGKLHTRDGGRWRTPRGPELRDVPKEHWQLIMRARNLIRRHVKGRTTTRAGGRA
jgi:hypothetical protein